MNLIKAITEIMNDKKTPNIIVNLAPGHPFILNKIPITNIDKEIPVEIAPIIFNFEIPL
ncbi:hypothetical protein SAMN02927925_02771 [Flavobacterium saliperosum]|uniref:Uncharacterized protein n=1 Tax=Flavobacterium saliperosum TaxID=329186 RepID=A0A1G4W9U2_9FLAO|nr:hypothetical protein SAMN02927925_02771 [Flavobacterium saliperosum]